MAFQLIINADDFGFSAGVTDGIVRSHREGVLTSTTLMATMPDRDRAIDLALQNPALGVGIHLSLTQGTPLTACKKILNRDGSFPRGLPTLFLRLRSAAARHQAREEFIAQVRYAQGRGLVPTHLDSHKHIAHLPALHGPLLEACRATGIKKVRTAREIRLPNSPKLSLGYRMVTRYAALLAARVAAEGLGTTDWFYGLATTGRTCLPTYKALAVSPCTGVGELMVHPGYSSDVSIGITRLLQERVVEMQALCDPRVRGLLAQGGITLTHF